MKEKPVREAESGDIMALKCRLWDAIEAAHRLLRSRSNDVKLRAAHAVSQSASAYAKLLQSDDLEGRLQRLEERAAELSRAADRDDLPVWSEESKQ